jgi:hypothetical protein
MVREDATQTAVRAGLRLVGGRPAVTAPDSPEVITGKRLLDAVKRQGFVFHRIAPSPDGPLEGVREAGQWRDVIHLGGFCTGCWAWRERVSSLIVPGGALVATRVAGDALTVLNTVLTWETPEVPGGR